MKSVMKITVMMALALSSSFASAAASKGTTPGYASGEAPCPFKAARDAQRKSQASYLAKLDQILGKIGINSKLELRGSGKVIR